MIERWGGAAGFLAVGSVAPFCSNLPGFSVFWILVADGRIEGPVGVSALAPVHGLADGLVGWLGWLGWLASFFVVFLFLRDFQRSERRLSFRLCRSRRAASAGVTGGSGEGSLAPSRRAVSLRGVGARLRS